MTQRLTSADFFTGLCAALALRGYETISLRDERFGKATANVFQGLMSRAEQEGLDIRFRIRLHPIHGDSIVVRDAILHAAQRSMISLDNPHCEDIRLKVTHDGAEAILQSLPGGKQLFMGLADEFLRFYERA